MASIGGTTRIFAGAGYSMTGGVQLRGGLFRRIAPKASCIIDAGLPKGRVRAMGPSPIQPHYVGPDARTAPRRGDLGSGLLS